MLRRQRRFGLGYAPPITSLYLGGASSAGGYNSTPITSLNLGSGGYSTNTKGSTMSDAGSVYSGFYTTPADSGSADIWAMYSSNYNGSGLPADSGTFAPTAVNTSTKSPSDAPFDWNSFFGGLTKAADNIVPLFRNQPQRGVIRYQNPQGAYPAQDAGSDQGATAAPDNTMWYIGIGGVLIVGAILIMKKKRR